MRKQDWQAMVSGQRRLYLSAFETQSSLPEVATAFNALAGPACLLRFLPGTRENVGPILMAADAGAMSGWHCDGTRLVGHAFKAGDVNAFHLHLVGHKRWRLFPPRHSAAVAAGMDAAPQNAFGNQELSGDAARALAAADVTPLVLDSLGGDCVLLAKGVWHDVETLESSLSLASDRLFADQLAELAHLLPLLDGLPLLPAKWAVRECLAAGAAGLLGDPAASPVAADILGECAAFLRAQLAVEPLLGTDDLTSVFSAQPPVCVTCDRPHECIRFCHACRTEIFGVFAECQREDCPWEACGVCWAAHSRLERRQGSPCQHSDAQLHFIHSRPQEDAALMWRAEMATQV